MRVDRICDGRWGNRFYITRKCYITQQSESMPRKIDVDLLLCASAPSAALTICKLIHAYIKLYVWLRKPYLECVLYHMTGSPIKTDLSIAFHDHFCNFSHENALGLFDTHIHLFSPKLSQRIRTENHAHTLRCVFLTSLFHFISFTQYDQKQ